MKIWHCPKCPAAARTVDDKTPMHNCGGMAGLFVPLVAEGGKVDLIAVEREDYIGREDVQYDANGRPVMAVITRRDDGEDCTVYAPTAQITKE